MNTLYLLTGPTGVGKSTISKQIAEKLSKSAVIDGDEIYHQVVGSYASPWKEHNHLKLFWNVTEMLIETYLKEEYDVVFNYFITREIYHELVNRFKGYDVRFAVLVASMETIKRRDNGRTDLLKSKDRFMVSVEEFKRQGFPLKYFIFTDVLMPGDVAHEVIKDVKFKV
ncbi:MAG: AAA family ATPase [Clostridia bacterium]|nr:AAA family ATPase [Clostridia bacterium]